MQNRTSLRIVAAGTPYIAVAVGLFLCKNALIAVSLYYLGILLFLWFCRHNNFKKNVFSGWNTAIAIIAILVGSLSGAAVFITWDFAAIGGINLANILSTYGLEGINAYVFVALAIILNPFFEELFWRDYLGSDSNKFAWIDAAFAGYHIPPLLLVIQPIMAALAFIVLCITGWLLRLIKNKSGGLLIPYLAHLAADASIIVGILFLIKKIK